MSTQEDYARSGGPTYCVGRGENQGTLAVGEGRGRRGAGGSGLAADVNGRRDMHRRDAKADTLAARHPFLTVALVAPHVTPAVVLLLLALAAEKFARSVGEIGPLQLTAASGGNTHCTLWTRWERRGSRKVRERMVRMLGWSTRMRRRRGIGCFSWRSKNPGTISSHS